MEYDFKYKVVVVTGATGGIGRALSWRFAKAGARIVLVDLDKEQLLALQNQVERSGVEVMSIVCDIVDRERCQQTMKEIEERFGGVDVLINNAGVGHHSLFCDTSTDVIRRVMEVNFFGTLNCTKAALSSLIQRKGMIITMSSVFGYSPMICLSGYAASKHALHGLFNSLRAELLNEGVHVMIACPGRTETDLRKHMLSGDGQTIEVERSKIVASPNDVAEAIFNGARKKKRLIVHSKVSKLTQFLYRYFPAYYEYKQLKPMLKKLRT